MTRRSLDWDAIRASYVEGTATDPDGNPHERTWPTLDEVAMLHGAAKSTVHRRSAQEEWPARREAFQLEVETARRSAVVEQRSKLATSVDRRALAVSDGILALVEHRVGYLVNVQVRRLEQRELEVKADGSTAYLAAGVDVDGQELAALGLATRRAVEAKDRVMGRPLAEEQDDTAVEERAQRAMEERLAERLRQAVAERADLGELEAG